MLFGSHVLDRMKVLTYLFGLIPSISLYVQRIFQSYQWFFLGAENFLYVIVVKGKRVGNIPSIDDSSLANWIFLFSFQRRKCFGNRRNSFFYTIINFSSCSSPPSKCICQKCGSSVLICIEVRTLRYKNVLGEILSTYVCIISTPNHAVSTQAIIIFPPFPPFPSSLPKYSYYSSKTHPYPILRGS